ncbi:hypothetical protein [Ramlibacter sp. Leaf400]|uniref:hypothetical protein n=1 Tax=Ramlibacter sp. Leaf400 TaxID=1736365 RepID=UPI0006F2043A|nr:hypothetical protein [Ramlibacter sp. Leaf400]KQT08073.1 hypothetical protein ASG30_16730 [Ramlibacter sp. Leaf400]
MSREDRDHLGTADLVAGAEHRERHADAERAPVQENAQGQDWQQTLGGMQPQPTAQDPTRPAQIQGQEQRQSSEPARDVQADRMPPSGMGAGAAAEQLAALFPPQVASDFRGRWDQVQIGFVDDPRRAVQQADELVADVMKSLASSFAEQRARLEAGLGQDKEANTEDLRMALRGYRSFFQRLLSL